MSDKLPKILLIVLAVVFLVGLIWSLLDETKLVRELPPDGKNCGSEVLTIQGGYNPAMRGCFFEAFQSCSPAVMTVRLFTVEGDPVEQTMVIQGLNEDGRCEILLHVDSQDKFGFEGEYETVCYGLELDEADDREYLVVSECGIGESRSL